MAKLIQNNRMLRNRQMYAIFAAVVAMCGVAALVFVRSAPSPSIEEVYTTDVQIPQTFTATTHTVLSGHKPPTGVWYYTCMDTPGNIIQHLRPAFVGRGFDTKLGNGALSANNKDLHLDVAITGSGQAHVYTVAITATETK